MDDDLFKQTKRYIKYHKKFGLPYDMCRDLPFKDLCIFAHIAVACKKGQIHGMNKETLEMMMSYCLDETFG